MGKEVTDTVWTKYEDLNKANFFSKPELTATLLVCLVEKFSLYKQQQPQIVDVITYVLVIPKIIRLKVADFVEIGGDI